MRALKAEGKLNTPSCKPLPSLAFPCLNRLPNLFMQAFLAVFNHFPVVQIGNSSTMVRETDCGFLLTLMHLRVFQAFPKLAWLEISLSLESLFELLLPVPVSDTPRGQRDSPGIRALRFPSRIVRLSIVSTTHLQAFAYCQI